MMLLKQLLSYFLEQITMKISLRYDSKMTRTAQNYTPRTQRYRFFRYPDNRTKDRPLPIPNGLSASVRVGRRAFPCGHSVADFFRVHRVPTTRGSPRLIIPCSSPTLRLRFTHTPLQKRTCAPLIITARASAWASERATLMSATSRESFTPTNARGLRVFSYRHGRYWGAHPRWFVAVAIQRVTRTKAPLKLPTPTAHTGRCGQNTRRLPPLSVIHVTGDTILLPLHC